MTTYFFKGLLQNHGWFENTKVVVDHQGVVTEIAPIESSELGKEELLGYALPGFQNAHSHAFQYAMAGIAELHSTASNADDFWGWREAMYQLALTLDPDQMEAIATMLYAEMARHGYTHVAEFHYLHHDKKGAPYSNLAEMGGRLISAAKTAGIGITLIPIWYQMGGFGEAANPRQKRFLSKDLDSYLKLFEASKEACKQYEQASVGIGVHSLRAVAPPDILEIINKAPNDLPFHLHISEQLKEVEDAQKFLGAPPVAWLTDQVALDDRFHLVHATHLTDEETTALAKSEASVVLCPSTEGNLGDGLFPLKKFQEQGGNWSIGTDSHVGLNPFEELRLLDYGQRLTTHRRNTYTSETEGDSAQFAMQMAIQTGRKAMGNRREDFFEVGAPLHACVLDANSPLLATSSEKTRLATILYASDVSMHTTTIAQGKKIVENGQHQKKETLMRNFSRVMQELKIR